MNQIYAFDQYTPPALDSGRLQARLDEGRLRRQTALAASAGVLLQLCVLLLGLLLQPESPPLAALCILYVCVSASGSGALALVFAKKRRAL